MGALPKLWITCVKQWNLIGQGLLGFGGEQWRDKNRDVAP